jgi:hypothetical protein
VSIEHGYAFAWKSRAFSYPDVSGKTGTNVHEIVDLIGAFHGPSILNLEDCPAVQLTPLERPRYPDRLAYPNRVVPADRVRDTDRLTYLDRTTCPHFRMSPDPVRFSKKYSSRQTSSHLIVFHFKRDGLTLISENAFDCILKESLIFHVTLFSRKSSTSLTSSSEDSVHR